MYCLRNLCNKSSRILNVEKLYFSSSTQSKDHYDIIIVGGGIIGSATACTLGKNARLSNRRILLLESGENKPFTLPKTYSNRVVSLNPATKKLLNEINVWNHIEKFRVTPVKRLQVMDALSDASITFGKERSPEDVSYIVENNLLIDVMKKEIEELENVHVLYKTKVKTHHFPLSNKNVDICLENGNKYSCELLIGCDGIFSQVRKAMGVFYSNWNYDNVGIIATLKLSEEIDNCIAWQRFLPTGPIALLPLTSSLSSLVWSTTTAHSKNLLSLSDEEFVNTVNEAFWKIYKRNPIVDQAMKTFDTFLRMTNIPADVNRRYPPKISSIETGSRASFPLGFGHATNYIAPGVVLVGDAAHRIHPLAGLGVNLGFGDVSCLNNILSEAVYSGSSLGNVSYLRDYETERQRFNIATMAAVEGLYRLYRTDFTPVVFLRSLGLQAFDVLNPVKKLITQQMST